MAACSIRGIYILESSMLFLKLPRHRKLNQRSKISQLHRQGSASPTSCCSIFQEIMFLSTRLPAVKERWWNRNSTVEVTVMPPHQAAENGYRMFEKADQILTPGPSTSLCMILRLPKPCLRDSVTKLRMKLENSTPAP